MLLEGRKSSGTAKAIGNNSTKMPSRRKARALRRNESQAHRSLVDSPAHKFRSRQKDHSSRCFPPKERLPNTSVSPATRAPHQKLPLSQVLRSVVQVHADRGSPRVPLAKEEAGGWLGCSIREK